MNFILFLRQRKDFRRLVAVMLKMIEKFEETDDDSLEMRSFHLLNMAAVEVDLNEKEVFGNLRGITVSKCSHNTHILSSWRMFPSIYYYALKMPQ